MKAWNFCGWIYQNGIIVSASIDGKSGMYSSSPRERRINLFAMGIILIGSIMGGGALADSLERVTQTLDPVIECNATNCALLGDTDWRYGHAHMMHWSQWADFSEQGVSVDAALPMTVDVWTPEGGPLTGIHLWGSFLNDVLLVSGPNSLSFAMSLHPDADSKIGPPLWSQIYLPGKYDVRACHDGPQGWYEAKRGIYEQDDHRLSYQLNFPVPEQAVHLQGGQRYWLIVQEVRPATAVHKFGLLASFPDRVWQKPARYRDWLLPDWQDLLYPLQHDLHDEPLDIGLALTGPKNTLPQRDLGDAPDSHNVHDVEMTAYPDNGVVAQFPTTYAFGSPPHGPIHWQPKAWAYLGETVTREHEADLGFDADPTNNLRPVLDLADLDGGDDGIVLPVVLRHCESTHLSYQVMVVNPSPSIGYVNIWFDWNRDGDWEDTLTCDSGVLATEWAVQDQQIALSETGLQTIQTPNFIPWHPPHDGEPGRLWMRIMLSERPWQASMAQTAGSGPWWGYQYGETEDYDLRPDPGYQTFVAVADYGDAPDDKHVPGYPTLSVNNGAVHSILGPWFGNRKNRPDHDVDGQPDPNAFGDDLDQPIDDEEGVSIPPLVRGETMDITLEVQGGGGHVTGWIDYNQDEVWQAAEKVMELFLPNGTHIMPIDIPGGAEIGKTFARFRISRHAGLSPAGPARDGEVEDHEVWIRKRRCKWVQWPDTTPNSMGLRVDTNDVDAMNGILRSVADDFECRQTNWLTHVRLWGTWKEDLEGTLTRIRLSIHSDDPVGFGGNDPNNDYSKPNPGVLWTRVFEPNDYSVHLYHTVYEPGMWWWDEVRPTLDQGMSQDLWLVNIPIPEASAFYQQGSDLQPVIYWLRVEVQTEGGEFAWVTRRWPDHYMDDAVASYKTPLDWHELRYPKPHPYYGLEMDSIDMAFCLGYTDDPGTQPTSRPQSPTQCPAVATRCPVVNTQCPSEDTRCPSVITRCPAKITRCPVIQTQCPPTETECQASETQCPIAETRCPPVASKCPPVHTQCPPTETICQHVETKCPVVETQCPPATTKCPVIQTQCPTTYTRCPPTETECQAVETRCPAVETKCPPSTTKCPVILTQCPTTYTRCPPTETECQVAETRCPVVETKCPPSTTKCPVILTQCPTTYTRCPPTETECQAVETRCPAVETECPPSTTKCPVNLTQCPTTYTRCPPTETLCQAVETQCPVAETKCPPIRTECPVQSTYCPPTTTRCPPVHTQCPVTITECQAVETQCPATETECEVLATRCPPVSTSCPIIMTRCPPIETRCPPSSTFCPPVDTRCPESETHCPAVKTKCPPLNTICPIEQTKCPTSETKCPVVKTQCPTQLTSCPRCIIVPLSDPVASQTNNHGADSLWILEPCLSIEVPCLDVEEIKL